MATEEADEALVVVRMPTLVKRERSHVRRELLFGSADLWYFFAVRMNSFPSRSDGPSALQPLCLYFKSPSGKHHLRCRRNSEVAPFLLNMLLGFQHACVVITSITAPALWLRGFFEEDFHYCTLLSSSCFSCLGS